MSDLRRLSCEVAVVGGGVFGLSSALELARRGRTVTVLDRFGPGHPATSSTGLSRSIRTGYGEPFYVELARDAIERWSRLERATGLTILHLTGQVDLGWEPARVAIVDAVRSAGAAIEPRTNAQLREALPELGEAAGDGLFHREAGTVIADAGMRALQLAAADAGVRVLSPERVTAIEEQDAGAVVTSDAHVVTAGAVVIAAGPWSGELLELLGIEAPLAPAVAQVTFLDAPEMVGRPGVAEWPDPSAVGVYGHPVPGVGYKIAFDAGSEGWSPDVEKWTPDAREEGRITGWLAERMPGAPRRVSYSQRHPWTMTPDSDWVIDRRGAVVLACGCSGHAFKFGPALGPLVADVVDGSGPPPMFALDRAGLRASVSASDPIAR
jgi:sarcosine oxidase